MRDEYAIVLDFLPNGHPEQRRSFSIAQVIGEEYFNLLEVEPREDASLKPLDRVYIGKNTRDTVKSIKSRVFTSDLTATAQSELPHVVRGLVEKHEKKFVEFFNKAGPLTTRQHQLEIIPGIGKKHMWEIIRARKTKQFESFKDIEDRIPLLSNPKNAVIKRILLELKGNDKWYLFIAPPKRDFEEF